MTATATLGAVALLTGAVLTIPMASAEQPDDTGPPADIEVTFDHSDGLAADGADTRTAATANIPEDLAGATCTIGLHVNNRTSVHPGNNLAISSGAHTRTLLGVEDVEGTLSGPPGARLYLDGDTVNVSVVYGEDDMFSAAGEVRLDCTPPPGLCPDGHVKVEDGFDGLQWAADGDYTTAILVGGPPDADLNQDPDGRDKAFSDVEEGDRLVREAHDISHVCVEPAPDPDPEPTPGPTPTSDPTPTPDPDPTPSPDGPDSHDSHDSHGSHEPETSSTVPETRVTVDGDQPAMAELPNTGPPLVPLLAGLAGLFGLSGGGILWKTRS